MGLVNSSAIRLTAFSEPKVTADAKRTPVKIVAVLTSGNNPVIGANVVAEIKRSGIEAHLQMLVYRVSYMFSYYDINNVDAL
jgi:hypothetical protein